MRNHKLIVSGLALALVSLAAVGTAAADSKCENVKIKVTNRYVKSGDNKDVKVVDMQYYDADDRKWRDEATTDDQIGFGDSRTWTKNLEYVGGESGVIIKLHVKYNTGGTSWSSVFYKSSAAFKCVDGMTVNITI